MFKMFKNQKGLTLIELLAVLVIVGIVAAIAIPAIGGVLGSSKTKADVASEKMIVDAAKRFMIDYEGKATANVYPTGNSVVVDVVNELVGGGYLEAAPASQTNVGKSYKFVKLTKADNGTWNIATTVIAASITATERQNAIPGAATVTTARTSLIGTTASSTTLTAAAVPASSTSTLYVPPTDTWNTAVNVFIIN